MAQNNLITGARATEIVEEVSKFMGLPVNVVGPVSMDTQKAIKAGLTEAGFEIALLRTIIHAAAHCAEDPYIAIAKQLYLAKNRPTERVLLEIVRKEGTE